VAYLKYYPGICSARLRKLTKASVEIAGAPTDIRNEDFQNRSIEGCRYTRLFDAYLLFLLVNFSTSLLMSIIVRYPPSLHVASHILKQDMPTHNPVIAPNTF
jgi:hypothetical protein